MLRRSFGWFRHSFDWLRYSLIRLLAPRAVTLPTDPPFLEMAPPFIQFDSCIIRMSRAMDEARSCFMRADNTGGFACLHHAKAENLRLEALLWRDDSIMHDERSVA